MLRYEFYSDITTVGSNIDVRSTKIGVNVRAFLLALLVIKVS